TRAVKCKTACLRPGGRTQQASPREAIARAGLTNPSGGRRAEEGGDAVDDGLGDAGFAGKGDRLLFSLTVEDNHLVGINLEAGLIGHDVIGDDQVQTLAKQLAPGILVEVMTLGRKTNR